jgi:hypothetical protein
VYAAEIRRVAASASILQASRCRGLPLKKSPNAVSLTAADGEDAAELGSCYYVSKNQFAFQCRRFGLTAVRMIGRKRLPEIGAFVKFLPPGPCKKIRHGRVCVCVCVCANSLTRCTAVPSHVFRGNCQCFPCLVWSSEIDEDSDGEASSSRMLENPMNKTRLHTFYSL